MAAAVLGLQLAVLIGVNGLEHQVRSLERQIGANSNEVLRLGGRINTMEAEVRDLRDSVSARTPGEYTALHSGRSRGADPVRVHAEFPGSKMAACVPPLVCLAYAVWAAGLVVACDPGVSGTVVNECDHDVYARLAVSPGKLTADELRSQLEGETPIKIAPGGSDDLGDLGSNRGLVAISSDPATLGTVRVVKGAPHTFKIVVRDELCTSR